MLGYNYSNQFNLVSLAINNNSTIITTSLNSTARISAKTSGPVGTAYGIAFGISNYNLSPQDNEHARNNTLNVSNIGINVETNNNTNSYAYGIWADVLYDPERGYVNTVNYDGVKFNRLNFDPKKNKGDKVIYNNNEIPWPLH
jgi:hypothetical protein